MPQEKPTQKVAHSKTTKHLAGAISADGTLILKSCTFTKNTAKNNGGAIETNIILKISHHIQDTYL